MQDEQQQNVHSCSNAIQSNLLNSIAQYRQSISKGNKQKYSYLTFTDGQEGQEYHKRGEEDSVVHHFVFHELCNK